MEIEVLGVEGASPDTIVSVRAGSSRRQAPISALGGGGPPFKFSAGPNGVNPFKVDLLRPVGSARLALKPGEGKYTVNVGSNVSVTFAVSELGKPSAAGRDLPETTLKSIDGGKTASPSQKASGKVPALPLLKDEESHFQGEAAAARDYLETHGLLRFVRALLQTVIRERPADPFSFIADQFRAATNGAVALKLPVGSPSKAGAPPDLGQAIATAIESARALEVEKAEPQGKPEPTPEREAAIDTWKRFQEAEEESKSAALVDAAEGAAVTGVNMGAAKDKARDALSAMLGSDSKAPVAGAGTSVEQAKAHARDALTAIVLGPGSPPPPVAFSDGGTSSEAVKARARDALQAALVQDPPAAKEVRPLTPDELVSAKLAARASLEAAFSNEDDHIEDRGLDAAEVDDAKANARAALGGMLLEDNPEDGELEAQSPQAQQLEDLKSNARDALQSAFGDGPGSESLDDSRPASAVAICRDDSQGTMAECEEATERARNALSNVIDQVGMVVSALSGSPENSAMLPALGPRDEDEPHQDELGQAKAKARQALEIAMDEDEPHQDELGQAKAKARQALEIAMDEEEPRQEDEPHQDEIDDAKMRAREALEIAMDGDEDEHNELSAAKVKAAEALDRALDDDGDEDGHNEELSAAKIKAAEALDRALDDDGDEEGHNEELSDAKIKAAEALDRALGDDGDEDGHNEELSDAKIKAAEALDRALGDDSDEATHEEYEAAREKAREALDLALEEEEREVEEIAAAKTAAIEAFLALDEDELALPEAPPSRAGTQPALDSVLEEDEASAKAAPPAEALAVASPAARQAPATAADSDPPPQPTTPARISTRAAEQLNQAKDAPASQEALDAIRDIASPRPPERISSPSGQLLPEDDPELRMVMEAKAKLEKSRAEMLALNTTLRAEVSNLTGSLSVLLKERDQMKGKIDKSQPNA